MGSKLSMPHLHIYGYREYRTIVAGWVEVVLPLCGIVLTITGTAVCVVVGITFIIWLVCH
jgi:hypothetical protein